jgi:hypothetical protein
LTSSIAQNPHGNDFGYPYPVKNYPPFAQQFRQPPTPPNSKFHYINDPNLSGANYPRQGSLYGGLDRVHNVHQNRNFNYFGNEGARNTLPPHGYPKSNLRWGLNNDHQ